MCELSPHLQHDRLVAVHREHAVLHSKISAVIEQDMPHLARQLHLTLFIPVIAQPSFELRLLLWYPLVVL